MAISVDNQATLTPQIRHYYRDFVAERFLDPGEELVKSFGPFDGAYMFDAGVVATAQPLGGGVGASLTVTQIRIEKTPNEPDNTSEDGWIDVMIRNTGNEPVRYHFGVTLVITRVIVQALT